MRCSPQLKAARRPSTLVRVTTLPQSIGADTRWCVFCVLLLGGCSVESVFPTPVRADTATSDTPDGAVVGDDTASADSALADSAFADTFAVDVRTDVQTPDTLMSGDTGVADVGDASQGCACAPKQVWLHGPCVATPALGCGATCTAKSCPVDSVCDPGAASSTCQTDDLVPACVAAQAMGFAPGDLRVAPTEAAVGAPVKVLVQGGWFYIGALWWHLQVGAETLSPAYDSGASCTVTGPWTPTKPGIYAVRVGYGGLQPGNKGLAGFITVPGPGVPAAGVQPGYPCSGGVTCAQGDGWACGCGATGRCACAPEP